MTRALHILIMVLFLVQTKGQTIGGNAIYNFLKLPTHPLAAASGGRLVSSMTSELGVVSENPALLNAASNGVISSNLLSLSPGLNLLNAIGGLHIEKLNTTFALSITHLSYGSSDQTDVSGNLVGSFMPYDQSIQFIASSKYGKHWQYGGSVKYINSKYGAYTSAALAADMGLLYSDEEKLLNAGFSVKNMGFQLKKYTNTGEDLPFDMSMGLSKKLANAPIRFSITAQKIHQFDILYQDTLFNSQNGLVPFKQGLPGKLLSHLICASDVLLGEKIVFTIGYNVLKRKELSIQRMSNGIAGFSYGVTVSLKRVKCYFSRMHNQSTIAYINAGLSINLKNN